MSADRDGTRIGVFGASGSGKSAWTMKQIAKVKRLIVFDTEEEYGPRSNSKICKVECTTVEQVRQAMVANWSGFRIAFVPPTGKEERALSALCRLLMQAQAPYKRGEQSEKLTLVVEEMNKSFGLHVSIKQYPHFAHLCSRGRKSGINIYGVSQVIAEVSTRFRGNLEGKVIFRQEGPTSVRAAIENTGATKAQILAIKNLEFLHSQKGAITTGKLKF